MPGKGAGRTGAPIGGVTGRGATGAGAAGLGAAGFGAIFLAGFAAGFRAVFLAVLRAGFRAAFLAVLRADFRADFLAVLRAGFRAAFLAVLRFRAVFLAVLRAEPFRAVARLAVFFFFAAVLRVPVFLAPVLFFLRVVRFFPLFLVAMAYAPILLQCRTRPLNLTVPTRIISHPIQACRLTRRVNHFFHYTMIGKEVAIWDASSATTNCANRSNWDHKRTLGEPFRRPLLPVQDDPSRSMSLAQGDG